MVCKLLCLNMFLQAMKYIRLKSFYGGALKHIQIYLFNAYEVYLNLYQYLCVAGAFQRIYSYI